MGSLSQGTMYLYDERNGIFFIQVRSPLCILCWIEVHLWVLTRYSKLPRSINAATAAVASSSITADRSPTF